MRLTPRDVAVVKAVYDYRFLQREQIHRLFFPSINTANFRLQRLYQHRYVQRIFVPDDYRHNVRNTQAVYCLDQAGATLLAAEYGVPREQIDWYPDRNKVRGFFLAHLLKINDFRIAISLAAYACGDRVVTWVPDWELKKLKERVEDPATKRMYPVSPDAYFIYEHGDTGKRAHFFLELDRATMENRRFARKVKAYIVYVKTGAYQRRYGTHSLRVLTVVPSVRRLKNLKTTTETVGGKSMFWFATYEALVPESILGPVWEIAQQPGHAQLFRDISS